MRYTIAASALCGLVAAAPQLINIGEALAVPTPTILGPKAEEITPAPISYHPAAAASAVADLVKNEGAIVKRETDGCGDKLPGGAGYVPEPGTVEDYKSENGKLRQDAIKAATPSGYTKSFADKFGSSQQIGYLTYKNIESGKYDVQQCADFCDSEPFCKSFNIFYERDPMFEPKDGCANPLPVTNVKCSLYGYNVAEAAATNEGQWRGPEDSNGKAFQVVIVGSNGYSKIGRALPSVDGFNAPTSLPGTINAPLDNGYDTYNGMRLFNDNPYDPSLCAAACNAQTNYDKEHTASDGSWKPCNFFTSYILTRNDIPLGTYCSFYTKTWNATYAVNTGYYYGNDKYSVVDAASYEVKTPVKEFGPTHVNGELVV